MNYRILSQLELPYSPRKPLLFGLDDALAFGLVSGIGGGLINAFSSNRAQSSANRANLQAVRETNKANLDLYREQFADQYKLWQENNEYNTPAAQMDRLRDAGLNPSLMMQHGGSTGIAQAASVPNAAAMQAGHVEPTPFNFNDVFQNLSQLALGYNQLEDAQGKNLSNRFVTRLKQQELAKSMADTKLALQNVKKGSAEESMLKAQMVMQKLQNRMYSETYDEQKQSYILNNELMRANMSVATEQAKNIAADKAYKDSLTTLNKINAKFLPAQLDASINELITRCSVNASLSRLNDEQANKYVYEQFSEVARYHNLKLDYEQKKQIMPYLVSQARSASKSAASDALWNDFEHGSNILHKGSQSFSNYLSPLKMFFGSK